MGLLRRTRISKLDCGLTSACAQTPIPDVRERERMLSFEETEKRKYGASSGLFSSQVGVQRTRSAEASAQRRLSLPFSDTKTKSKSPVLVCVVRTSPVQTTHRVSLNLPPRPTDHRDRPAPTTGDDSHTPLPPSPEDNTTSFSHAQSRPLQKNGIKRPLTSWTTLASEPP